jgi:hypothetical protein
MASYCEESRCKLYIEDLKLDWAYLKPQHANSIEPKYETMHQQMCQ